MLKRIISGGQTGADRAALDAALEKNFPCGGWCPAGRIAEDGAIPPEYPLRETGGSDYEERTLKNVLDSDGTLILTSGRPTGGTALTAEFARRHGKPCFIVDVAIEEADCVPRVKSWLLKEKIEILNVAGPRASKNPGIYAAAKRAVGGLLEELGEHSNEDHKGAFHNGESKK